MMLQTKMSLFNHSFALSHLYRPAISPIRGYTRLSSWTSADPKTMFWCSRGVSLIDAGAWNAISTH